MNRFAARRARVRLEFAWLYPEIEPGVWMNAKKVTAWARQSDVEKKRGHGCARGRVLCDVHFEFRGGRSLVRDTWTPRAPRRELPV
jgi:hypothetical protein